MGRRKQNRETDPPNSANSLTEAEWIILRVVWENEPCTAGDVQEAVAKTKDWAYSTVKTMMDRMVQKGLLKTEKIRNLQLFRARISQDDARKSEFRKMLERAFEGAITPMMQFLVDQEEFSVEELKYLRQLANKAQRTKG